MTNSITLTAEQVRTLRRRHKVEIITKSSTTYPFGRDLWVRETWAEVGDFVGWDSPKGKRPRGCGIIAYKADGQLRQRSIMLKEPERKHLKDFPEAARKVRWQPPEKMRRWASRFDVIINSGNRVGTRWVHVLTLELR